MNLEWFKETDNSNIILAGGLSPQNVHETHNHPYFRHENNFFSKTASCQKKPKKTKQKQQQQTNKINKNKTNKQQQQNLNKTTTKPEK